MKRKISAFDFTLEVKDLLSNVKLDPFFILDKYSTIGGNFCFKDRALNIIILSLSYKTL